MSKQNRRDPKLYPYPVAFLNKNLLALIDDMFFSLPFPYLLQLEKWQEEHKFTADTGMLLNKIQADLLDPRAMTDFRMG